MNDRISYILYYFVLYGVVHDLSGISLEKKRNRERFHHKYDAIK
jgi:hypothetical protein